MPSFPRPPMPSEEPHREVASTDALMATPRARDAWFLLALLVVAVSLVIAIANDAHLAWDGAFYLFQILDKGEPFVAHGRAINGPLHWPVVWMNAFTDSMPTLRATFGVIQVLPMFASLALSWWVVRKEAPGLVIWPIIGIGLATLPGQINWVNEGGKAHQLIWPVLLAVLIGLPARTIPLAALVSLVIMNFHPAASTIFLAITAAALVTAWLRPRDRERLVPFALTLAIAAILRYGMITNSYERGEMNLQTLERQFRNSATAPVVAGLLLMFLAAGLLILLTHVNAGPRWSRLFPAAVVSLCGVAFVFWANDPTLWWDALEFRGPGNFTSLAIAGAAFVDATLGRFMGTDRHTVLSFPRWNTASATVLVFATVISVQSVRFGEAVDNMNATLASSDAQCIEFAALSGMPESPLNLWSTPAHSLLYQGWRPDKIVLQNGHCERAMERGDLPIAANSWAYDSDRIDLVPLQWELGGHGACWWDEPDGWHPAEVTEIGRRRWSADTGTIRVFAGEPTTLTFTGEIVSFTPGNTVEITVNGEAQASITFDDVLERPMDGVTLELSEGENVIRFTSANDAGQAPGDPRDLAFSLLNVEPVPEDGKGCSYRP